ncbi:MAG: murein hydrolase activator EnvC [Serratia symbiotica]|nr:murein hydrolase activator EnvC [Serratia symbiotica]
MKEIAFFPLSKVIQSVNADSQPLPERTALRRLTSLRASVFCVGVLLWSLSSYVAGDNKSQLKDIQRSIAEKEKVVKHQLQQRRSLQGQFRQQEKTIAQVSRQMRDTQGALNQLDEDIYGLNAYITKQQKQQSIQQSILAKQLYAAFRHGQHRAEQLILSGEEIQRSERILAYFSYLNKARQQPIEEMKKTRNKLAEQKTPLVAKKKQLKMLLGKQQIEQQKLELARSTRKKTLTAIEASLEKDQQQLVELRQKKIRLRDKIVRAEREYRLRAEREAREAAKVHAKEQQAKKTGTPYQPSGANRSLMARTGGLGRPEGQAIWPVRGSTLQSFGEPLHGELRWKGMVIKAREGSEVKAIADGRVLLADWLQGYGLVVVIEHRKGDMSLYGYNQSALVNVGTQVRAGQPIALVGTSGGQGTPSLYFEIRRQGQAVNPLPWLGR